MELRAYAKLNLCLQVNETREDGLHEVDTLMQSIDLFDTLMMEEADGLSLQIDGGLALSDDNLVLQAARHLQKETGCEKGAALRLCKRIPVAAGLAGGSADAAAALLGLNRLWGLDLPQDRLLAIGRELGSDVPFCMVGGLVRATGTGTDLRPLQSALPSCFVVLSKAGEGISAKDAYQMFDRLRGRVAVDVDVDAMETAIAQADFGAVAGLLANDLQPGCGRMRPEVFEGIECLYALGAEGAAMSGSGSCVFGLFREEEAAKFAAKEMQNLFAETHVARPVGAGVHFM